MCRSSVLTMVISVTTIFIISVFVSKVFFFFCKCSRFFPFSCDSRWLFVNFIIFFVSKLFIIVACSLKDFFHAIFTSVYITLIFYTIKWPCDRHWIPSGNVFSYFCCRWFFKIIFTIIYSFNQNFRICINSGWCFIRFSVLMKLNILVFSEVNATPQKSLFSHTFLLGLSFFFCSRRMKKIHTIKMINIFWCYSSE